MDHTRCIYNSNWSAIFLKTDLLLVLPDLEKISLWEKFKTGHFWGLFSICKIIKLLWQFLLLLSKMLMLLIAKD